MIIPLYLRKIIVDCIPWGIIKKKRSKKAYSYIREYLDYKAIGQSQELNSTPNYNTVVSVQGFGYSGSGAVVDVLREYNNCNVFGYVDPEGSLSNQVTASGEMDFIRHSGGLFEIEKHIGDNNIFQNDFLLHNYLKLVSSTSICQVYDDVKYLFYDFFDKISENNIWNQNNRYYNAYLLPSGKSELLFLKSMTYMEYVEVASSFLVSVFNSINTSKKDIIVLDQVFSDMNFDYNHYAQYCDNLKFIAVYRDPRDVYTFAKIKDVEWIPHNNVSDFINWNRIMYRNFDIHSNSYLSVRFEDLVTNYERTINVIESYVGLNNSNHIFKHKHFSPSVSAQNIEIWKDHIYEFGKDFEEIYNNLTAYCFDR